LEQAELQALVVLELAIQMVEKAMIPYSALLPLQGVDMEQEETRREPHKMAEVAVLGAVAVALAH
jgi:hypothetical protein